MRAAQKQTSLNIRQRAEEKARLDGATTSKPLSLDDAEKLIFEMQVHQIELEMQNEELSCTQHELEVSRARYLNLYDLAPVGYLTLNADGVVVEANLTAATTLGVVRSALLNKPLSNFILPNDKDVYYRERKRFNGAGEMRAWEMRLMHADGSHFWAYFQTVSAQDGDYLVAFINITDRKLAEQRLQETSLISEQLLHSTQEGVIVYDMDLRYRVWNPFMEHLTGLTADEVLGKHPLELFPFLQDAGVFERLKMALAGETPGPTDFPYSVSKSGASGWFSDLSAPLRNLQGEIVGVSATVRDITYRKQLEEELLNSNIKLQVLIAERTYQLTEAQRIAHIGSWERNFQTKKSIWSDEVYRIFGLEVQQAPATFELLMDCIHPEDHNLLNVSYERSVKENIPLDIVLRIINKTNFETRHIHIQCIHLRSPVGRVIKSIGTFHDVTELLVKEKSLKGYASHVVKMIENERTRIARELHDDLGQKLTMFSFALRGLKHDHPELLKTGSHLSDMGHAVDGMMESIRRICTTLRPLLLEELGLLAALESLCREFSSRSGIICSISSISSIGRIDCISCIGCNSECCDQKDRDCSMAIFRIVQESLNNIIKHATASKVSITLFKNDNTVTMEIIDNGCGFNAKKASGAKSFGIIGMRERAENIGATFDVVCKKGGGTTVRLVIPCRYQENTE